MSKPPSRTGFLVLASRRAFEALVGPVPERLKSLFRFQKPRNTARIRALLPNRRVVISKSYTRPESNRWIFEARRLGIPTILLVDGPLEWANLYTNPSLAKLGGNGAALFEPIIHDAVATIGNAQHRWIESRNPNRGIEFMGYANQRICTQYGPESASSSPDFDFLLTTAKTPYFSDREKTDLGAMFSRCGAALERAGYRTLVRIFDPDLRRAVRSSAPSCTFDESGSFADALSQTRCVVGTPSSVMLESMYHDRPTGLLNFRDDPLFYRTGWLLEGDGDWKASFASMLERDPTCMNRQRQCLRQNLSDQDFFTHCERISTDQFLAAPRSIDPLDLEFEHQIHKARLDRGARGLAQLLRALRTASFSV